MTELEQHFDAIRRIISRNYYASTFKEQALIRLEECQLWAFQAKPKPVAGKDYLELWKMVWHIAGLEPPEEVTSTGEALSILLDNGMNEAEAREAVEGLKNAGVLFRDRTPDESELLPRRRPHITNTPE